VSQQALAAVSMLIRVTVIGRPTNDYTRVEHRLMGFVRGLQLEQTASFRSCRSIQMDMSVSVMLSRESQTCDAHRAALQIE
jgi:hypothetical protein